MDYLLLCFYLLLTCTFAYVALAHLYPTLVRRLVSIEWSTKLGSNFGWHNLQIQTVLYFAYHTDVINSVAHAIIMFAAPLSWAIVLRHLCSDYVNLIYYVATFVHLASFTLTSPSSAITQKMAAFALVVAGFYSITFYHVFFTTVSVTLFRTTYVWMTGAACVQMVTHSLEPVPPSVLNNNVHHFSYPIALLRVQELWHGGQLISYTLVGILAEFATSIFCRLPVVWYYIIWMHYVDPETYKSLRQRADKCMQFGWSTDRDLSSIMSQ
jgi:hypothetical protein